MWSAMQSIRFESRTSNTYPTQTHDTESTIEPLKWTNVPVTGTFTLISAHYICSWCWEDAA